jgi:7,8-dihydropterin-6-yl-methyl-4-(beta-D-ribofuranosyl)aminobenzene 5'-phosphate synthase
MRISVLTENYSGPNTGAEHGISYLVEADNRKILFDTGQSALFRRNAEIMNISLEGIDTIILSHGHFDHGNGLKFLDGGRLVCHPSCFDRHYRKTDRSYIGLDTPKEELAQKFDLVLSDQPLSISPNVIFLGEIPRITEFESRTTPFIYENGSPDFVPDDSALVIILPEGLFLISGCGHSGLVNMLEHARKITGCNHIYGVQGGFHLKYTDNQTHKTIEYLLQKEVSHVIPSHCNEQPALQEFRRQIPICTLKTGDILEF